MYALTVPAEPREGSSEERDLAYRHGRRVAARRTELAMTQSDLAHELAVDTRTVKKLEAGEAPSLNFAGRTGQSNVSRLENGDLVWSGSGENRRFVGPGLALNARLERVLKLPTGGLIYGLWVPPPEATAGSLVDHVRASREIDDDTRSILLAIIAKMA